MAHDPSKCNCSDCDDCKPLYQDGVEVWRICGIDHKGIEFWGADECPKQAQKGREDV